MLQLFEQTNDATDDDRSTALSPLEEDQEDEQMQRPRPKRKGRKVVCSDISCQQNKIVIVQVTGLAV